MTTSLPVAVLLGGLFCGGETHGGNPDARAPVAGCSLNGWHPSLELGLFGIELLAQRMGLSGWLLKRAGAESFWGRGDSNF